jgi:hypothetical protein
MRLDRDARAPAPVAPAATLAAPRHLPHPVRVIRALRPLATAVAALLAVPAPAQPVAPLPAAVRTEFGLPARPYVRYLDAGGIPILGSAAVGDAALQKARAHVLTLLATRPGVAARLRAQRVRVVILARGEGVGAIPEYRAAFPDRSLDKRFWGGFGATPTLPIVAGTEANLIDGQNDENVFVHEFAHTVAEMALAADPGFARDLAAAWSHARKARLWANTYAGSNRDEYWAEGVQAYFDVNREGPPGGDGVHNDRNTRAELREYDPLLFALIDRVYGGAALRDTAD